MLCIDKHTCTHYLQLIFSCPWCSLEVLWECTSFGYLRVLHVNSIFDIIQARYRNCGHRWRWAWQIAQKAVATLDRNEQMSLYHEIQERHALLLISALERPSVGEDHSWVDCYTVEPAFKIWFQGERLYNFILFFVCFSGVVASALLSSVTTALCCFTWTVSTPRSPPCPPGAGCAPTMWNTSWSAFHLSFYSSQQPNIGKQL